MYNKQTWLDEIPDMTKPIYDASGKQKTDPQTGRPLFELVQVGTRITSNRLNTMEGGIEAAHTLVEQLAKEMGGNFVAVIDGVMGLSCSAEGLKATWTAGVAYVGGRRYEVSAGEMALNPTQGQYLYVDISGVVKKTTSQETAKAGLLLFYVATDTSGVISSTDGRVNISLEEILRKIENTDIPDASLTEKGKVKLSNKTDGASQTDAATEKAVNDARVAAITAAAANTETKVIQGYKDAQYYVDAKPWQKVAVTDDSGFAINITGENLDTSRKTGWYMGSNVVNAPSADWYFFEIIRHNNEWEIQNAYSFNNITFQQRAKRSGVWTPWTPDVFQSGVDAKNGIVGAINAMGGSASTSDTWATLATKIQAIQTGVKYATGTGVSEGYYPWINADGTLESAAGRFLTVTGLSFRPKRLLIVPVTTTAGADGTYYNEDEIYKGFVVYGSGYTHYAIRLDGSYSWVNASGFRLFVEQAGVTYRWHAFG